MGMVDGYGCAEKTHPPVICLSIWHLKNRKRSGRVYEKNVWLFVLSWCGVYVLVPVISSSS